MFCPKCGKQLQNNSVFCSNCGTAVGAPTAQSPDSSTPAQPQMPMGWFKFLINFALWAGAILNIISAIPVLTGSQYGDTETAEMVYTMFEGLKRLDMISGFLAIALGVFGIYTRFQLAGFKINAPKLLIILYVGAIVSNLVYVIGYNALLPTFVLSSIDFTSFYTSIITSAVMIFVNITYFKKREHLFVNE